MLRLIGKISGWAWWVIGALAILLTGAFQDQLRLAIWNWITSKGEAVYSTSGWHLLGGLALLTIIFGLYLLAYGRLKSKYHSQLETSNELREKISFLEGDEISATQAIMLAEIASEAFGKMTIDFKTLRQRSDKASLEKRGFVTGGNTLMSFVQITNEGLIKLAELEALSRAET